MKTIKLILTLVLMLLLTNTFAQVKSGKGTMEAVIIKKFKFEENGVEIPYTLKILESRNYDEAAAKVAKLIYVDAYEKDSYDRFIVLRYNKQTADTFKLVQTKNGFAVEVDDKQLQYLFGEGIYFLNNADKDFFIIDEFDIIL